ncbi:alpha/beta fold hydrolase [Nocardia sp. NPDC051832]|uniref:alpha/beta fold hydrolase n=1 Tax=Nocardia sp. NPDC051832 TaxID=3155673 RepID=UPI0034272644
MTTRSSALESIVPPSPRRRRRRIAALLIVVLIAGLLLVNAVAVNRQEAAATGDSILSLDGGDIAVYQDGPRDAPALVLIHGLAASANWWESVVPELSRSYRVIRIDMLGHGRSAKPADGDYSIPAQARRVGAVLDGLGVARAVVVGHSTGGSVATALAEQRSELVTALGLVNTGPRLSAFVSEGPTARLLTIPVVGQLLWRFRTDGLIRKSMGPAFTRDVEIPQQLVADVRGLTYHSFTATAAGSSDYVARTAVPARLTAVGKPLLVIFGAEDRRWNSASAADYRVVPGARVELLPGVGHSPMVEDPARTAAILLEFTAIHAR